ncbi:biotin/lipoyl-containing protein [Trichococcus shcherbakoviae]|uniref:Acetyl-CoA carboxylase biotin carboxyl carrier protein subunit n=1 Tax=Trichococcus shcherbakoviae subsp. psychrophilus TaxID=2585775 RepID=A0A5C5E6I9_9LACT|nr:biotin/lipoyl-containing protein [Trichococcus shcherbakoviae]OUL08760.1 acetyl-CoA carboxylase biotin carboxyl carrier protein subunit [Sedimentibacter sp. SX930]TNV68613.1 acetyl-CoA carboxylase biotin carboxyl carrier protein subunit [Trichococcus shcherbakoviae subsp. psychrophilus]
MLRKFRIKINEKEYMVEMEEFGAPAVAAAPAQAVAVQAAPVAAPVAAAAPTAPAPTPVVGSGEGDPITAPMPGKILDIKVNVGDVVTENQVLAVLEAMKLENEIVAPRAGTITAIVATKGAPIDVGQTIVIIQ